MQLLSSLLAASFLICFQAHCINYSIQDLGLESNLKSFPTQINNQGTLIGKFKGSDNLYTDFMWTSEKGLILLNSKQATGYQNPLINENNQVIGLYWKPIYIDSWWGSKRLDHWEKNLYTYDLENGFADVIPPANWRRDISVATTAPSSEDTTLSLNGYSDKCELFVKNSQEYGVWNEGAYTPIQFDNLITPLLMNSEGKISFLTSEDAIELYSGYLDLNDVSESIKLNYFEDYIGIPLMQRGTVVKNILKNDNVIGVLLRKFEDNSIRVDGFLWNPLKGYTFFPDFIPIAGNTKGQMVGFSEELGAKFWDIDQMYSLDDLVNDATFKILKVVDMNESGQIAVIAIGPSGKHAYLLNPY